MDWFCSLPIEILPNILSFLSTKEAVQTCILSKIWRHAWTFLPVLKFDIKDWVDESVEDKEIWREGECKFQNFMYGVLKNRVPEKLDEFRYKNYIMEYESKISFEFPDRVKWPQPRVILVSIGRDREDQLALPDFIFSCTRIEVLKLRISKAVGLPIFRPQSIHLPALKIVHLMHITLDSLIQNLCSKCPVLEIMVLAHCELDISEISSKTLKELTIYDCSQSRLTQISCPCLEYLYIKSFRRMAGFELKDTTSLEYAKICLDLVKNHGALNLLSSLSNVSHLSLGLWGPQFKVKLEKDISECSTFRNLQTLRISYWNLSYDDLDLVACFLKHSPLLEKLTLRLHEPKEGYPKEELSQEKLRNRRDLVFQREYLKVVKIVKPEQRPDIVFARLIHNLRTHIKKIGIYVLRYQ
ncbi:F-box/LRR-repeat protein At3g26922-like [Carex rostrata]